MAQGRNLEPSTTQITLHIQKIDSDRATGSIRGQFVLSGGRKAYSLFVARLIDQRDLTLRDFWQVCSAALPCSVRLFGLFSLWRLRSRMPGPPPFSSMNPMPSGDRSPLSFPGRIGFVSFLRGHLITAALTKKCGNRSAPECLSKVMKFLKNNPMHRRRPTLSGSPGRIYEVLRVGLPFRAHLG